MPKLYFGQIGILKPEMVEEYERLHANAWSEVLEMIRECNLRNYSIFRHENQVFSYYEYIGDNYEKDMEKMAADPATQKWWTHTHPCFETFAIDKNSEFYHDMKQIFYCD